MWLFGDSGGRGNERGASNNILWSLLWMELSLGPLAVTCFFLHQQCWSDFKGRCEGLSGSKCAKTQHPVECFLSQRTVSRYTAGIENSSLFCLCSRFTGLEKLVATPSLLPGYQCPYRHCYLQPLKHSREPAYPGVPVHWQCSEENQTLVCAPEGCFCNLMGSWQRCMDMNLNPLWSLQ